MPGADGPNGTDVSPVPHYEWRYEYYDEDEPVSFEGLGVHRYSIVIGFWVGLAVFVIFLFFLLTLLSKTGAPHPDNAGQHCEKRPRLIGSMDTNLNNEARPPHPRGTDSSCSVFQCYVSTEGQVSPRALRATADGADGEALGGCHRRPSTGLEAGDRTLVQEPAVTADRTEKQAILPAHFSIPNCVSSD